MSRPVLIVSEFFPPERGGIQRSLELLRPAWGDDVQVITPVKQDWYPGQQRSLFSGRFRPRWTWLIGQFWKQARGGRRLIIFGHYSAAVAAAWLLRPFGVQYIVLTHGNDVLMELRRPSGRLVSYHLRRAEWVGVNSFWLAGQLKALGVPAGRLIKTHPAVADDEGNDSSPKPDDVRLLTIARLVPRKNISSVLRAVAELKKDWPDLRYDIVGEGPEREALGLLSASLELEKNIVWHGRADDDCRRRLLREAGIFILTPTVRDQGTDIEGLGTVFLEAGAARLPIIASRTGGIPDIVIDDRTGVLVEETTPAALAAAISRLLTSSEDRHRYGAAARQLVDREFRAGIRTRRMATMMNGVPVEHQPKISVIIPAYNSARTIGHTLTTLVAQTWTNVEIIVVNDGSTDNLPGAIAPFRDRIIYLEQSNAGAPAARNRGADAATGEYLLFLDSDITMVPEMLSTMAAMLMTHPEASYVYSDFKFGLKKFHLFDFSPTKLRQTNYIHTSSLMRREAFRGFDLDLKRFQDWDLWLSMLKHGHRGLWIPRQLFSVNQKNGTMSAWVPSFVYRVPHIGQGVGNRNIRRYREAEAVIRKKHHLS